MANYRIGDLDYKGGYNYRGQLATVVDEEAIAQSIRIWLVSLKGDMPHYANSGGILYEYLVKPMNQINVEELENALEIGLEQDFYPSAELISSEVTPNYEKRYWELDLVIYIPAINYELQFNERLIARA